MLHSSFLTCTLNEAGLVSPAGQPSALLPFTFTGNKDCCAALVQVDVLMHNPGMKVILSGGSDGYLRLWDFNKVNIRSRQNLL